MAALRGQHRKTSKQARWAALGAVGTAVGVAALAGAAPSASASGSSGWGHRAHTGTAGFGNLTNIADLQAQIQAQRGFAAPAAAPAVPTSHLTRPNYAAYPNTREGIIAATLFSGHRAEYEHRSVSAGIADHLGIAVPEGFRPVAPTE